MKKKPLLFILLFLALAAAAFLLLRKKGQHVEANVLVITLDTTRADHIGAYGSRSAQTPNIDRLAREGTMFRNCYAQLPLTLPSHCTLFTGRYPMAHNVRNNAKYFLNPSEFTLAEALHAKNYRTYAVIAAFVLMSKFGLQQGFDFYDDYLDPHELAHNFKSEIPAGEVYDKFSAWLAGNSSRKFFAWVHFYDAHDPYNPPVVFAKRFANNSQGRYDGEIAYVDSIVGKIVDDLRERGLLEKTLLVIAGDHGEAFGEHQEYGHAIFCYEENLRVPLIFRCPALIAKGRSVPERVSLVDVMPTVLDILDIPVPGTVQGKSFMGLLRGRREKEPRSVYFESMYGKEEMNFAPLTGIMDKNFKYISLPEPELYDLQNDRLEKENLFKKKNIVAKGLDRRLGEFVAVHSQRSGETRRELTRHDMDELQALGYISAFSGQAAQMVDPKQGVIVNNALRRISRLIAQNEVPQAEKELLALTRENPGRLMPQMVTLSYKIAVAKKDYPAALNILSSGIRAFPESEQFRLTLARDLFDIKKYDRAESRCREILERDPKSTAAFMLLGEIREKQGQLVAACDYYAQALKLEPQNVSLNIKYAELLLATKKYPQAVDAYDQALSGEGVADQPELFFKVALLNIQYGSMERAERMLARAVAGKPEGKYFFNYALVLAKNGKVPQALAAMETAVSRRYAEQLSAEQRKIAAQTLAAWKESE
jgi:arylsulfatase A-like enzyme/Tfp pilus assembly protein PilF